MPQVVRELLEKALVAPLLPSQQQTALAHMAADPQVVFAVQLQPQQLPALVEHTPMLAYHVLVRMVGSRQAEAMYQVCVAAAVQSRPCNSLLLLEAQTSGTHAAAGVAHAADARDVLRHHTH